MLITVAETLHFQRAIRSLLSEQEKEQLLIQLASNPDMGVVIRETGGIRKLVAYWRVRNGQSVH